MAGLSFPDVGVFVSGSDPNDPNTVELWSTNLAPTRTWRINNASRGRQYETDQNITGTASIDWRNVDEALNPANPSSPLAVFVKPMRRTRMMASYPPAGTGNLINSNAGTDPTVDSYTVGTLPPWLVPVGGTNPTVQAANPHSGANSVQYTVAGTAPPQGVSTTPLTVFPGRQYTASWFVRQSSASTQQIAVGGLTALDRFQRTGALNGSTSETGQAWSFSGGVTGDYTTAAGPNPPGKGAMLISNNSVNVFRWALLGVSAQDFDYRAPITIPTVATGAAIVVHFLGRFIDFSNQYRFELDFNTNGTVDALVKKNVGGSTTQVGSTVTAALTYTAGSQFWVRVQGSGTTLQLKAWQVGTVEPAAWTITVTDGALTAAGQIGTINVLNSGNTNGTVVISYGPLAVTAYSTPGTTTTTTGSYQRLSVTFTATQPAHTVAVTTVGTAVAGTVNLDDIQLEPGASASAFTSSGPLVRGFWGGHVMDYPVTWVPGSQGFEGAVSAPLSGPFAALSQIPIHTDVVNAILRKSPAYYWALWDQSGATLFSEISGNNGPPLQRLDGALGPGPVFALGAPINLPGDPGGVGLACNTGAVATNVPASVAQTGLRGTQPITVAGTQPVGWSLVFWVSHTALNSFGGQTQYAVSLGKSNGNTITQVYGTDGSPNTINALSIWTGGSVAGSATDAWADGQMHMVAVTVNVGASTGTQVLYVDGVAVATNSSAASAGSAPADYIQVGGFLFPSNLAAGAALPNGVYAHVAVWNRVLSAQDVADLATAGKGNVGEMSGTRAGRYLANYYTGPSVVDSTTLSRMGPPTAPESTSLIQALQRIQDTEAGNFFENRDGAVQFDGRDQRYLRTTPTVVFGDGPSEIPYTESPLFGYGLTQTNNQALVTRSGGIRAVANPDNTGSGLSYYGRGYTLQVDCQTDNEAIDHANWVVATRQQPQQRVTNLRVDLGSNPAQFVAVLNLEIGTRATVNRRPKAANSGAGITMSQDYFVEKISHAQIDPETGTWFVDLEMSPVPPQVWILGDTTYSVLGSTTRLGF